MPSKKRKYNARFPAVSAKTAPERRRNEKYGFVLLYVIDDWYCVYLFVGANQEDNADWRGSGESGASRAYHNLYPFQYE